MIVLLILICFYPLYFVFQYLEPQVFFKIFSDKIFLSTMGFTLLQAVLSSVVSIVLALLACPGYCQIQKGKKIIKALLILPQLLSPTVIVLAVLIFWPQISLGLIAIVFAHTLTNTGFAILILAQRWQEIEAAWGDKATLLGAKWSFFIYKVMLPQLTPFIKNAFILIFVFCLNSLFVPLVLGGGPRGATIEVLIYEKMKIEGNISEAVVLSIIQWCLQLAVFFYFIKSQSKSLFKHANYYQNKNHSLWSWITVGVVFLLTLPFLDVIKTGIAYLNRFDYSVAQTAIINSLAISIVVSLLVFILTAFLIFNKNISRISKTPQLNQMVIGVAGVLIWGVISYKHFGLTIFALSLLYLTAFYLILLRLVYPSIEIAKEKHAPVLKQMGVNNFLAFKKIYLPLLKKPLATMILFAFCWSLGEFAIASLVAPSSSTLPLLVQELIGQYRLEWAAGYSLIIILFGIIASLISEVLFNGAN